MILAARTKQWTARNSYKNRVHTGTQYKVETWYSGTRTMPEFWRGYLKKGCVHISAQRVAYSDIVPRHRV